MSYMCLASLLSLSPCSGGAEGSEVVTTGSRGEGLPMVVAEVVVGATTTSATEVGGTTGGGTSIPTTL